MALSKRIALDNGVILNYHRVNAVHQITNVTTVIEVISYTSAAKRAEEKAAFLRGQETGIAEEINVYTYGMTYSIDYDPTIDVTNAYDYLKTLDEFAGANDVNDD